CGPAQPPSSGRSPPAPRPGRSGATRWTGSSLEHFRHVSSPTQVENRGLRHPVCRGSPGATKKIGKLRGYSGVYQFAMAPVPESAKRRPKVLTNRVKIAKTYYFQRVLRPSRPSSAPRLKKWGTKKMRYSLYVA